MTTGQAIVSVVLIGLALMAFGILYQLWSDSR